MKTGTGLKSRDGGSEQGEEKGGLGRLQRRRVERESNDERETLGSEKREKGDMSLPRGAQRGIRRQCVRREQEQEGRVERRGRHRREDETEEEQRGHK